MPGPQIAPRLSSLLGTAPSLISPNSHFEGLSIHGHRGTLTVTMLAGGNREAGGRHRLAVFLRVFAAGRSRRANMFAPGSWRAGIGVTSAGGLGPAGTEIFAS